MTEKQELATTNEYAIMDSRDEEQVLAELQGHYLTEFVYSFKIKDRTIIGLSWAGVKEIAYRQGGIQVEDCKIEEKSDSWLVTCKALDVQKKASRFGVANQSKIMKHKDGTTEPDDFALQKAVSKAQRNAMRALMPEITVKQYIDRFLDEKLGRKQPEQPRSVMVPSGSVPKDVQLPFKAKVMNAIRPDIANILEAIHEDENILVLKPTQRLELNDFKETCGIIESQFNGKWIKEEGIWEIPSPKPTEAKP